MTGPASRALFVSAVAVASARLREQGVEHFADHALACARELADTLKLLLNLRRRAALGGLGIRAHQFLDAERLRDRQ